MFNLDKVVINNPKYYFSIITMFQNIHVPNIKRPIKDGGLPHNTVTKSDNQSSFTHVSDHICNCSSYLIACRSSINAHCFGNSEARNSITYLLFLYKQPFKRKSNMADGRHFKIALDYNTGSKRGITYLNTCNLPNCGSRNSFMYLLRLYDLPFNRLIQYGRQPF